MAGAYPLRTGLQVVQSNCGVFFKELYQKLFPKAWLSLPRHRKGTFLGTDWVVRVVWTSYRDYEAK